MKKYLNINIIIYFLLIIVYLTIAILNSNVDFFDAIIFVFAVSMVLFALNDLHLCGVNFTNVFAVSYFGALVLNSLRLSVFQEAKSFMDLYYFFLGPILFICIIRIFEKNTHRTEFKKIFKHSAIIIKSRYLSIMFLIIYIATKSIIFYYTGVRFFDDAWLSSQSDKYVVPVLSGVNDIAMYLLLMQIPQIKNNKYKALLLVLVFVFSGVLMAKRGNMVRIFIYIFIYMLYSAKRKHIKKIKLSSILLLMLAISGFAYFGNFRQEIRGDGQVNETIASNLGVDLRSPVLNWMYAYIGLNHDVLKKFYYQYENNYSLKSVFLPFGRLLYGNKWVEEFYNYYSTHGINGFNASTYLTYFIADWGELYFVVLIIFGLIIGLLIKGCMFLNYDGGIILLTSFGSLSFFGNYLINPAVFLSLLIGMIVRYFQTRMGGLIRG